MLEITIPCEQCGAALGFGESRCKKCGSAPSGAARDALHARLEAASDDYRELQSHISAGRTALFVAALVYLAIGAIAFLAARSTGAGDDETSAALGSAFFVDLLVAACFLLLWWLARRAPAVSMLVAAAGWLGLQAVLFMLSPLSIASGLLAKGFVAILMVRGIVAGVKANRFIRRLRRPTVPTSDAQV
jgi:hypothetical protein